MENTEAVPRGLAAQIRFWYTLLTCLAKAAWAVFVQRPLSGKTHPLGWPKLQQLVIGLFRTMGDWESVEAPRIIGASMMTNDPAKWPKELTVQQVTAGTAAGPPAYWLQLRDNPAAAEGKPVTLFHIHGGGFFCGHPLQYLAEHVKWLQALAAKGINAKILAVDYLWAPEHPFPAALDAVVAAYDWLVLESGDTADVVVGGDSAGGALALTLLFNIRDRIKQQQQQQQRGGLRQPVGALLVSPHVDFSEQALVFDREWLAQHAVAAEHDIIPPGTHPWWERFLKRYIGNRRELRSDPRVSPILNPSARDLVAPGGKLLVVAGGAEVMIGDILRFVDKARADGTAVELLADEQEVHGWALFPLPHQAAKHKAFHERLARAVADSCGVGSSDGASAEAVVASRAALRGL